MNSSDGFCVGRLLAFTARGVLRVWLCRGFVAGCLLFHGIAGQAAMPVNLDLNGNGISDVWESLHQTEAFALDSDSDGDGVPNRSEAMAGTDPRNAQSVPRINSYGLTTNGFVVSMRGALGKRMELQSAELTPSGAGPVWTAEGSIVARTNAEVILIAPADRPSKIFRMSVSDVDTDGDGLNLDRFSSANLGFL
ncbi:MAG TPA: hypothetical protein VJS65_17275 [Verrucomicrobiae bacterium]|nr:hypothetical protein [Verrucomicrobiae bacterium]